MPPAFSTALSRDPALRRAVAGVAIAALSFFLPLDRGLAVDVANPPRPAPASRPTEPTRADCIAAVDKARALTLPLSEDHLSRVFAERYLGQSMMEAGNGEYDDCLYWAERATEEIEGRQHDWQPGERLKVLGSDERP
jgi:hypothetical protein